MKVHLVGGNFFYFTAVYGSPNVRKRSVLWAELSKIAETINQAWLLAGDWNTCLEPADKKGGVVLSISKCNDFREWINSCGLLDLGFVGPRFTWTRNQVYERIDRALGNLDWQDLFEYTSVTHLPRIKSDHNPLLIQFGKRHQEQRLMKPFRFQAAWLSHTGFKDFLSSVWNDEIDLLTALSQFMMKARSWSREIFGDVDRKKRKLIARLNGIQRALARYHSETLVDLDLELKRELALLLEQEEMMWYQRSRSKWIVYGDQNTRYFHSLAKAKQKKQKIERLRDEDGVLLTEPDQLATLAWRYYSNLFIAEPIKNPSEYISGLFPPLSDVDFQLLDKDCSMEEIKQAVFSLGALKAPGPDGVHALFYQTNWELVKSSIWRWIHKIFSGELSVAEVNDTMLCLIPKITVPMEMSQFRPIGLCNVTYKFITKILVHRLQNVLPKLISPNQTSFVPGRQMIDNILVAQEVLHSFHTKQGKQGFMAIKVDLEKAYDRLSWNFIEHTLHDIGFPARLIALIMDCVSSSNMRVLWNGVPTESFKPQRGVRQGDPLSPYLFVLCLERLAHKIDQLVCNKEWKPMRFGKKGPVVSHLFFADDMLLFAEADSTQAKLIQTVLQEFCEVSGQKVSAQKTRILFSKNVPLHQQHHLSRAIGFVRTDDFGKYLGMPLVQGRVTKNTFADILLKVDRKLAGWKHDKLSFAGRVTLAKAVLRSIPAFAMQTVKLPVSLCDLIDKKIRSFLWGSKENRKKVHLVAWETMCRDKSEGGLGFRTMRQQNEAFLMKLAWGVMMKPEAFWVNILRHKYGKGTWNNSDFKTRGCISYQWRGIVSVWEQTKQSICWRLGNGKTIDFWHDAWLDKGLILSRLVPENVVDETSNHKVWQFVSDTGGWNWNKLNALPLQLRSLIDTMKAPSHTDVEDKLVWGWTKNGQFTTKSAYNAIGSSWVNEHTVWKSIWKWPGPQRIKSFLWLAAHEAFLCNSKRKKIGISESDSCPMCGEATETPLHVLRDCRFAKGLWIQWVEPDKWRLFFGLNTRQWIYMALKMNFSYKEFDYWRLCFGVIIWQLWKWRNAMVFNEDDIRKEAPMATIQKVMNEIATAKLFRCQLIHL